MTGSEWADFIRRNRLSMSETVLATRDEYGGLDMERVAEVARRHIERALAAEARAK